MRGAAGTDETGPPPFALSQSKGPRSPFDAAQDERMRGAAGTDETGPPPFTLSLSKGPRSPFDRLRMTG